MSERLTVTTMPLNPSSDAVFKEESGNYVGKNQARQLLNAYNGIGVYRNGFRIRPLGDADFDWLKLNARRVQNPSLYLGNNQVIGHVHIESDYWYDLEEKSARDGLKENETFNRLKEVTLAVIRQLERRRYRIQKKSGLESACCQGRTGAGTPFFV